MLEIGAHCGDGALRSPEDEGAFMKGTAQLVLELRFVPVGIVAPCANILGHLALRGLGAMTAVDFLAAVYVPDGIPYRIHVFRDEKDGGPIDGCI